MRVVLTVEWRARGSQGPAKWPEIYRREVDRPYSRVPAVGEAVCLGDDDASAISASVSDVQWGNDGTPVLEFEMLQAEAGWPDEIPEWLLEWGFELDGDSSS